MSKIARRQDPSIRPLRFSHTEVPMTRVMAGFLAALISVMLTSGAVPAAEKKPDPADLEKQGTTPAGRYEPSLDVLRDIPVEEPGAKPGLPVLAGDDYQHANQIYFQRCAGCHGVLRKGATGKALTTDITRERGFEYLRDFITYGSPGGMPNWGGSGDLTQQDGGMMARHPV